MVYDGGELEYLTATFGGPSLGQAYPFFVAGRACEPLVAEDMAGKIAVVERGDCELLAKAESVQAAGGVAMILVNDGLGMVRMSTVSRPFSSTEKACSDL